MSTMEAPATTQAGARPLPGARWAGLGYAVSGFLLTHLLFAAFILFLLGWVPYPNIDGADSVGPASAVAIDIVLIVVFGLQHSGMARAAIKRFSARLLPASLERATYVHCANIALVALIFLWQPLPTTLWDTGPLWAQLVILALFGLGWALASWGSLLIDHLQLLGIRQAWTWSLGEAYRIKPFQRHWLYDRVRHPIQLGLLIAFWAAPHMTFGHAILAGGLTIYILLATKLEERDLVANFGDDYRAYSAKVPGFIPRFRRTKSRSPRSG